MSFFVAAIVTVGVGVAVNESEKNRKEKKAAEERERQRLARLSDAVDAREAEYQTQADAYNTAVDSYNASFNNAISGLTGLRNNIGGLTIADLYDDPTTSANENQYDNYLTSLNNMETALGNLSFSADRPTFSSVLTTDDGTATVDDIPTLGSAMTGNVPDYLDTIDNLRTSLKGLSRDRRKEENRISDFQSDLNFDLGQINRDVGRLDISQTDRLGGYEDQLADLERGYNAFSSDILGQVGGLSYDDSGIESAIQGLRDARSAEETRIENFGTNLGNFADTYADNLSGYNITNLDDLNNLQGLIDTQQDAASDFDSLLDFDFSNQLNSLGQTERGVGNLLDDREAELDRISAAELEAQRRATGLSRFADSLGIADIDSMNDLGYDIDDYNTDIGNFESLLDFDFSGANSTATGAAEALAQLRTDRQTELDRIDQFGTDLGGFASQYATDLGGYNIANIDEMDALQELIDQRQNEARRFSSELDFDFDTQLDDLRNVEGDLGDLYLERQLEQGRIEDAERDYLRTAQSLDRLADSTGIYSKAGIDALQEDLDNLNADITGFESLLDFDFSGSDEFRNQAGLDISDLYSQRGEALDAINNPIAGISEGAAGLELYDETGMRDARGELSDLNRDLSRFSGGRVEEIQGNVNTAIGDIDTRLEELNTYRNELETKAQGLLEQVNNATYYGLGDLEGDLGSLDAQQAEIELYNAQVAMDELDQLQERLYGERNRLEQDAQNVAARQTNAQDALLNALNAFGLPQFDNLSQIDPMTMQQFMAMIQNQEEDEDEFTTNPNAFSSNVIRVG
jgi:hypothetical protein